jgi:CrcB protein
MLKLLLLFAAGGVGALLRYGLGAAVQRHAAVFPAGTLTVNLLGCLAAGFAAAAMAGVPGFREEYRIAILGGLLGSFTTLSTFSVETLRLWEVGRHTAAVVYVLGSVIGGLLLAWMGWRLGSEWIDR